MARENLVEFEFEAFDIDLLFEADDDVGYVGVGLAVEEGVSISARLKHGLSIFKKLALLKDNGPPINIGIILLIPPNGKKCNDKKDNISTSISHW